MRGVGAGLYAIFNSDFESIALFVAIILGILAFGFAYFLINLLGRFLFEYSEDDDESGCMWFMFVTTTLIGIFVFFA